MLALGLGCGGWKYAIATTPGEDGKTVRLSTWIVPAGKNRPIESMQLAMVGAGCQITKAFYEVDTHAFLEGTCDNFAIKFTADLIPSGGKTRVHAECAVAVGEGPCKAAFTRVLEQGQGYYW